LISHPDVAHPFWFQFFGAVMGLDWHFSEICTSVIRALKGRLAPLGNELGIHVCGGRRTYARQLLLSTQSPHLNKDSRKPPMAPRHQRSGCPCKSLNAEHDGHDGFQGHAHPGPRRGRARRWDDDETPYRMPAFSGRNIRVFSDGTAKPEGCRSMIPLQRL
jgi:hypothetical protein